MIIDTPGRTKGSVMHRPLVLLLSLCLLSGCPAGVEPEVCEPDDEGCGPDTCDGEDDDPRMLPGSPCISCHSPGNLDDRSEVRDDDDEYFTLAGTAYLYANGGAAAEGAEIEVTDSNGVVVTMTANRAGNFYSADEVEPPLQAVIRYAGETLEMRGGFDEGDCNVCHACAGEAEEKIYAVLP